jgi:hypothetical protein
MRRWRDLAQNMLTLSYLRSLWLLTVGTALIGCTTPSQYADGIAASAHMQRELVATHDFKLTAFSRISRADASLMIYIEGDGLAWRTRSEPSDDPTPRHALGLRLAAADPGVNVVYLSRPCQFTPMTLNPRCNPDYWTGKRFAAEVVDAINEAVSEYARRVPGQPIHLVGYSGGGALAVLVAARRADIASLRTVAGNLDLAEVNRLHHVSAMPDSLSAMDAAVRVAAIPQIHFSGADDAVVPPEIARRFAVVVGRCASTRTIEGMSHASAWESCWPALLADKPVCTEKSP